jgi:chorismate-pyruvate lyase
LAGARDAKQAKMRGMSFPVGHRLRAHAAMIRGELERLTILAQAAHALQGQQIGRVRDNFRAAHRRYNFGEVRS